MEQWKTPIFEGVSQESRQAMKTCFGVRELDFAADEIIYDFASARQIIGIVVKGSAVIERIDEKGVRTILEHLEGGSVFGEMLMFENTAGDSITVRAEKTCHVWFMNADQITKRCENACDHHTRVVENMFHLVAEKATALSARVEVLSRRSIREKLMGYFTMQCARSADSSFELPFSLSALADYISADRSAMMRELKKMREESLVAVDGRKVKLLM